MAIIRWTRQPDFFSELRRMQREMARVFPGHWGDVEENMARGLTPPVNIYDNGEVFSLSFEIPGVEMSTLVLSVTADTVSIQGERRAPELPENASYHRRERLDGRFSRSITLPEKLDPDSAEARYVDGVLRLQIRRAAEARPRKIEVQA